MLEVILIVAGAVYWLFSIAAVTAFVTFGDDLPFNRVVRGLMILFAPVVFLGLIVRFIGGALLSGIWEAIR